MPHQWLSCSSLKIGRWKVPGSNPVALFDLAEFSVVFSETRLNTCKDPLYRPSRRPATYRPMTRKQTIGLKTFNLTRNSRKYRLGSLRKTCTEHTISKLRSHKRKIGLNPNLHPSYWKKKELTQFDVIV